MGDLIRELFQQVGNVFRWWIVIAPWEQAVRVRLGKHLRVLDAGIHLRIPYLDIIYRQSTRLRTVFTDIQTLTMSDGAVVSISCQFLYEIVDIERLYQTLHHPEDTLSALIQAAVARFIAAHTQEECSPVAIQEYVTNEIDLKQYGLSAGNVFVKNFAVVRTYRLIMDKVQDYLNGDLNMNTDS